MTIQEILYDAANTLKTYNIANPNLDSEILLSKVLKKDRKYIIFNLEKKLKDKYLDKFKALVDRRKKGEPIAYLTNQKDFWKETFYVNKNVLIPRPDTELIIEQTFKIYPKKKQIQVLDIGTGSGCIILSLLKERPNFYGTGIDISKKSLKVSIFNARLLKLSNRIKFYNSDVDNFNVGKYDLIVSNPPYIKKNTLRYLKKDVVRFEPNLALNGGFDGFLKTKKVIKKAFLLLKKKGKLILEIGSEQRDKVTKILKHEGFYINKVHKDFGNNDRCIISTKI